MFMAIFLRLNTRLCNYNILYAIIICIRTMSVRNQNRGSILNGVHSLYQRTTWSINRLIFNILPSALSGSVQYCYWTQPRVWPRPLSSLTTLIIQCLARTRSLHLHRGCFRGVSWFTVSAMWVSRLPHTGDGVRYVEHRLLHKGKDCEDITLVCNSIEGVAVWVCLCGFC